jgi:hypothetical protein
MPYIAVIGDIRESQKIADRNPVQVKLNSILADINKRYKEDVASKFMITLGDEFQGLLRAGDHITEIIEKIEMVMHPVKVCFGIGVGRITTNIDPDLSLRTGVPAYYNARKMINELKTAGKKKMAAKCDMKIDMDDNSSISDLINSIFSLTAAIKAKWTDSGI